MNLLKKVGDISKESNSEKNIFQTKLKSLPNSTNFSSLLQQLLGSLMNSHNSLKITQDEAGRANTLGVPIQISGADTLS